MSKYKRINASLARDLFNHGYNIYLVPSKTRAYPIHPHIKGKPYTEAHIGNIKNFNYLPKKARPYAFEELVEQFMRYNCNKQQGRRVKFYVYKGTLQHYRLQIEMNTIRPEKD